MLDCMGRRWWGGGGGGGGGWGHANAAYRAVRICMYMYSVLHTAIHVQLIYAEVLKTSLSTVL